MRADGSLGVGLLTVLSFSEVVEELKNADVEATALDFIVCSCGAYIMYIDTEGNWKADEAWEAKAMYRWDKKLVVRCVLWPAIFIFLDSSYSVTLHLP